MRSYLFAILILSILIPLTAIADSKASLVPEKLLPTVTVDDFTVGRQWTWDYFETTGTEKLYSTERYTVLARRGSEVLIELSSDYNGSQNLKPSHRLRVDVDHCLRAYRNPVQKSPWRFKMYYLSTTTNGRGVWTEVDALNTLAFEEKFNCNPRDYQKPSAPYLTVYGEDRGRTVFMQKLWRRIAASWFYLDGPERGVAARKDFPTGVSETYSFRLRLN